MPTTYANSINSNPIYADRAEKDASGNVITTTYATKAEIPSDELPAKSASDAGKALVVNSAGTGVEWSSVGGGASYTAGEGIAINSDTISVLTGSGLDIGSTLGSDVDTYSISYIPSYKGLKFIDTYNTHWYQIKYYHVILQDIYNAQNYAVCNVQYPMVDVSGDYVIPTGTIVPLITDMSQYTITGTISSITATNIYVTVVGSTGGYAPNEEKIIEASTYIRPIVDKMDVYVSNPVPTATASDAGKVLTVNSAGTSMEWASVGGSSSVVVSSPLSGEGTVSSPLSLSIDTSTLEVSSGGFDLAYKETFESNSDTALYLDSAGPVTITVSGLASSASTRNVWVAISWDLGSHFITWTDPMVVEANSTTATFTLDVQDIDTAESMGSWSTAAGRDYYFYFTADDGSWSEETYSEVTAGSGAASLTVKTPVPSATASDASKVLGVTATDGTLGWVAQPTLASLNSAGITDIVSTAALPASPVATVLYLIPEA